MTQRTIALLASLTVAALCAACSTTSPEHAKHGKDGRHAMHQQHGKEHSRGDSRRPPRPAGGHGLAAIIGGYDVNHDGIVTREEFDSVRLDRFRRGDTNGDGWLSEAEYVAEFEARLKQEYAADGKQPDDFYDRAMKQAYVRYGIVDADKNGQYTPEEDRAIGERAFTRSDTNQDGVLSKDDPEPKRDGKAHEKRDGDGNSHGHGKDHGKGHERHGKGNEKGDGKAEHKSGHGHGNSHGHAREQKR